MKTRIERIKARLAEAQTDLAKHECMMFDLCKVRESSYTWFRKLDEVEMYDSPVVPLHGLAARRTSNF